MDSKIFGVQTWMDTSNQLDQLGRDQHQNIFYTQCKSNEIINVSIRKVHLIIMTQTMVLFGT